MKKKIEDALRTEYAGLGLSDKTIGRLADFLMGSVEKEEDIATAVKRDDVKLIAKSIQGEIDGIQKAKQKAGLWISRKTNMYKSSDFLRISKRFFSGDNSRRHESVKEL